MNIKCLEIATIYCSHNVPCAFYCAYSNGLRWPRYYNTIPCGYESLYPFISITDTIYVRSFTSPLYNAHILSSQSRKRIRISMILNMSLDQCPTFLYVCAYTQHFQKLIFVLFDMKRTAAVFTASACLLYLEWRK